MKKITFTILSFALTSLIFTSCSKEEGCTDPAATNFNVDAQRDDGSCKYEDMDDDHDHNEASVSIVFNHHFDGIPVNVNTIDEHNFMYVTANNDTISISKLKYLLSGFTLKTASGDMVHAHGYHLFDVDNSGGSSHHKGNKGLKHGSGLVMTMHHVEPGNYASLSFTFGFDSTDNAGNYTDLNSENWNWPSMLGGGYHFMQFEGKYKEMGMDSSYAYHYGTAQNGPEQINHQTILLPGISVNEENVVVNVDFNVAELFRNPNLWDLPTFHSSLMMNYTAQKMMQANVLTAFKINNVVQKP